MHDAEAPVRDSCASERRGEGWVALGINTLIWDGNLMVTNSDQVYKSPN